MAKRGGVFKLIPGLRPLNKKERAALRVFESAMTEAIEKHLAEQKQRRIEESRFVPWGWMGKTYG